MIFGFRQLVKDAIKWLDDFIKHRLKTFGDYEDAVDAHSYAF